MADDPTPDQVTAYLAEVRERSGRPLPHVTSLPIGHDGVRALMESAADVPRLLAALEKVLAIADGWQETAATADARAERAETAGMPAAAALLSGRAQAHADCAKASREVISRALLGEGE